MNIGLAKIFLLTAALVFSSCGKVESIVTGASDLTVELQIPSEEDPEFFWEGITRKTLRLKSESKDQEIPWSAGSKIELEVNEGDTLEFSGFDSWGEKVVKGQVQVGEEKRIIIPLEKVL